MTTQTLVPNLPSARSLDRLAPQTRATRTAVARWALGAGQPLNLDAITVIIEARRQEAAIERRSPNRWTTSSALTFLFEAAPSWCERQHVAAPSHLGESLHTYLNYLSNQRLLAPGSSPIRSLRTAVIDLSHLTPTGHRRPTAGRGAACGPIHLRRRSS